MRSGVYWRIHPSALGNMCTGAHGMPPFWGGPAYSLTTRDTDGRGKGRGGKVATADTDTHLCTGNMRTGTHVRMIAVLNV